MLGSSVAIRAPFGMCLQNHISERVRGDIPFDCGVDERHVRLALHCWRLRLHGAYKYIHHTRRNALATSWIARHCPSQRHRLHLHQRPSPAPPLPVLRIGCVETINRVRPTRSDLISFCATRSSVETVSSNSARCACACAPVVAVAVCVECREPCSTLRSRLRCENRFEAKSAIFFLVSFVTGGSFST